MARGVNESGRSRSHRGDSPWRSPFCTTSLHRAPNNSRRATRSPKAPSAIRHRPTRAEVSRTSPTNLSRHRPLRPQHSPDGPQPHTLCTPPSLYAPCPTPTETRQLKRDPCASPLRPSRNPAPTSLRHPRSPPDTSSTHCCDFGPASRKRPPQDSRLRLPFHPRPDHDSPQGVPQPPIRNATPATLAAEPGYELQKLRRPLQFAPADGFRCLARTPAAVRPRIAVHASTRPPYRLVPARKRT